MDPGFRTESFKSCKKVYWQRYPWLYLLVGRVSQPNNLRIKRYNQKDTVKQSDGVSIINFELSQCVRLHCVVGFEHLLPSSTQQWSCCAQFQYCPVTLSWCICCKKKD